MVTTQIRLYRDEDFGQVVDIAVGPPRQARSEASYRSSYFLLPDRRT